MPANVHIESCRIRAQQMVMHRRNLDPAFDEFGHHRVDLRFKEKEITHDHPAAMRRFERHPTAKGQCRFDGDAVERYGEVSAGKTITVNVTRDGGLSAKRRINLLPINFLSWRGPRHDGTNEQEWNNCTHINLLAELIVRLRPTSRRNFCEPTYWRSR